MANDEKLVNLQDLKAALNITDNRLLAKSPALKQIIVCTKEEYDTYEHTKGVLFVITDDYGDNISPIPVKGIFETLGDTLPNYGTWEALPDRYEWDDEGDFSGNGYCPLAPTDNGMRMYIRQNMVMVKIINMNVDNFNNDTVYIDDDHAKYRPGTDVFTQTGDYSSATASGVFCLRATGKFTKFVTKAAGNLLLANFCYPCVNNPDRTFHRYKRIA